MASTKEIRTNFLHGEPVLPRRKGGLAALALTLKHGWLAMWNASGYLDQAAEGATKVGQISGGFMPYDVTAGAADGEVLGLVEERPNTILQSTGAGDAFVDADAPAAAYAVDNETIGKLGTNRSLAGLFLGLDEKSGEAILWPGRVAHAIARALVRSKAYGAKLAKLADASASTATAETPIPREDGQARVRAFYFVPGAALTGDDTDYVTITIKKRAATDYTTAVTVASVTTKLTGGTGSWIAFTPVSLGAITNGDLLVGDILTATIAKAGAGKVVPLGYFRGDLEIG